MYGLFCLFCSELRCRERTGPRRLRFAAGLHGHRLEHRLRHHRPVNRARAYRVSHWTPISVSSKSWPFLPAFGSMQGPLSSSSDGPFVRLCAHLRWNASINLSERKESAGGRPFRTPDSARSVAGIVNSCESSLRAEENRKRRGSVFQNCAH
jgi:hypothetical protein